MTASQTPIIWHNEVVGFIEDMKGEMFDVYGKWLPLDTQLTHDFLSAIKAGEELWVQVGTKEPKLMGTVQLSSFHEDKLNIRYSP